MAATDPTHRLAELRAIQQQRRLTPAELREAAGLLRELGQEEQAYQSELAAARAEMDVAAPPAPTGTTFVAPAAPRPEPSVEPVPCGLARPAMVTALVGLLVPCLLPIALLLGLVALIVIAASRGRETGVGHAVTAVAVPVIWMPVLAVIAAIALPFVAIQREKREAIECQHVVKQLCVATRQYAEAHGGMLPPEGTDVWVELRPYLHGLSARPNHGMASDDLRYEFREELRGRKLSSIKQPGKSVMWFESKDGGESYAYPHLGDDGRAFGVIGFADGHVRLVWAVPVEAGDEEP